MPLQHQVDILTITAAIPNREVRKIYVDQTADWFTGSLQTFDVKKLYRALLRGTAEGTEEVQNILAERFLSSMSYFDTQEAYYHGILRALLQLNEAYLVDSNREIRERAVRSAVPGKRLPAVRDYF